jgi:myo-inositol-1(or 4)-monophosphatase
MINTTKELKVAKQAAKKAGDYLWKEFLKEEKIKYRQKSKYEIVTKYDMEAEKIILKLIKDNFPDHQFLSEEKGLGKNIKSDYLWIIDPLDGTTNFSIKNSLFGVSVALAYKGEVILGAIYIPFLGELFWAQKSKGAFLNNKKIHVSRDIKTEKLFLTYCHNHRPHHAKRAVKIYQYFKMKNYEIRQLGSAVVEFSWVASGRTDVIMIPGANSWDVAAGAILVKEAGGKTTDFKGEEWGIKSKDIVASNGKIHKSIIDKIKNI